MHEELTSKGPLKTIHPKIMSSGETAPPLNDLLKVLNDLEFKAKHESETSFKLALMTVWKIR